MASRVSCALGTCLLCAICCDHVGTQNDLQIPSQHRVVVLSMRPLSLLPVPPRPRTHTLRLAPAPSLLPPWMFVHRILDPTPQLDPSWTLVSDPRP
eukprot:3374085-Rhodomonas_salina.2